MKRYPEKAVFENRPLPSPAFAFAFFSAATPDRKATNEKSFQVIDLEGLILVAGTGFEPVTFRL
jgi:hypothetical protein